MLEGLFNPMGPPIKLYEVHSNQSVKRMSNEEDIFFKGSHGLLTISLLPMALTSPHYQNVHVYTNKFLVASTLWPPLPVVSEYDISKGQETK